MKRREFITLLGGAAAAWPLAARAQQAERMRRIGVLMALAADDPEGQARLAAFVQGLQQLGWTDGRNVQIDYRWGAGDAERIRRYAAELAALAPDVILAAWRRGRGAIAAGDPHRADCVHANRPIRSAPASSKAWRGRAATSPVLPHSNTASAGNGWNCSKQIAPRVTRAAVLRDPAIASGIGQFGAIQAAAPSLGVELRPVNVRDASEIERAVAAFARSANGGLIVTASALAIVHRELIITLAARHKLPAVYSGRFFVRRGGLISYGPDSVDQHRRAAGYVDRILKGEKPADLPVQAPTKYELVINLKTAKALGLERAGRPCSRRADEVIE